jgi:hypothetical protein
MNRLLPWLGLFIATAAACGGKVIVDGPNGGEGGAGGSSSSTVAPSTGTLPSTSTGPSDLCAELCSLWSQSGCNMDDCPGQCASVFQTAGACIDELTSAIQCIIAHPNETTLCDMPTSCIGQIDAYQSCISPASCGDLGCVGGSDGSCGCKGTCNGEQVFVACKDNLCTCGKNGEQVGICKEAQPSCDPLGGCCADILFP